ncbi:MAG: preprotein translocase subunit SecE [Candidatus Pacebacteria bacterium]|jgi:preprotein translocase SecE subunit|nr:preprotein translocase subunit SecE [Candidatus Paceibacterota bacterium]
MERFSRYIRATIAEMKHVKWPTRRQASVYTVLVIGISAVVMIFVSLADFVFTSGIDFVVNRF